MGELNTTLHRLTLEQHLLAGIFLLGYGVALGSMFSPRGRRRAALLSLLAAAGFAATTRPWEHGVLLIGCAIAGVALFIATAWLLSRLGARVGVWWQSVPAVSGPPQQPTPRGTEGLKAPATARISQRRRRRAHTA